MLFLSFILNLLQLYAGDWKGLIQFQTKLFF